MFGANDRPASSRLFSAVFVLFKHQLVVVCWDILLCLGNLCIINEHWKQNLEREGRFLQEINVNLTAA